MKSRKCFGGMLALLGLLGAQSFALAKTTAPTKVLNFWDGFESSRSNWSFVGTGAFIFGAATAYEGNYSSRLIAPIPGTWSAVGRQLNTPSTAHYCTTSIRVKSVTGTISGNLEVIDPATWTYVTLKSFTIDAAGWYAVVTPTWGKPGSTVFLRLSLGSGAGEVIAYVDEMGTTCWDKAGGGNGSASFTGLVAK